MAADVVKLTSAQTVNGQSVAVAVDGDKVTVDGAHVVKTDIAASNGVIHVIDAVILPQYLAAGRSLPPERGEVAYRAA